MSNSNFTGKVITVTGAVTGIGLEVVKILAACGAKISVCDINKEGLEKFEDWYEKFNTGHQEKGGLIITHVDVTQSDQVNAWIKKTVDHFGRLDGAVKFKTHHLAGVWGRGAMVNTVAEIKDDDWAHTIS
ncbi:MAG: hypothetical protein M1830_005760, partial [Pleopsidium flavum]